MDLNVVSSITVKWLDSEKILFGVGNYLCHLSKWKKRIYCDLKPRDKIHEIDFVKTEENIFRIVCSAGREILITGLKEGKFQNSHIVKISEWISAIKFYEDFSIGLVTAHNFAINLKVDTNATILNQSISEETSTLYCAHIVGSNYQNSIYFAGTALGQLIAWKPYEQKTLIRINAHNGVIFSIAVSLENSLLVTASDDRSIKIWKLSYSNGTMSAVLSKQCFGHIARVFAVKILEYENQLLVASTGEDSNVCIWDLNGNLIKKKKFCFTGTIWNLDYNSTNKTLVTCSDNGRLNQFTLKLTTSTQEESLFQLDNQEPPAKIKYVDDSLMIVVTTKNNIFYKNYKDKTDSSWKQFKELGNIKVTFLDSNQKKIYVVAANFIHLLEYDCYSKKLIKTSEIIIDQEKLGETGFYFILALDILSSKRILTSDDKGKCLLINIENNEIEGKFLLPHGAERWTTSALLLENHIFIADRNGKLHLYDHSQELNSFEWQHPLATITRVHGGLGITQMLPMSNVFHVKTAGSDGSIKVLEILPSSETKKLKVLSTEKTLVKYIEKVIPINGKLYVFGFNDDHFVVYEKSSGIIYEAKVGGRHRNWDFIINESREITVTYIHKKNLKTLKFELENNILLDTNWHIKETNKVLLENYDNKNYIMISGGEDNVLKLTLIERGSFKVQGVVDITTHISSIKTICTTNINNELWVLSAGGRGQINATRFVDNLAREEISYMISSQKRQNFQKVAYTIDPETKFTCMILRNNCLFVGCSDGFLRIFTFNAIDRRISCEMEFNYERCILNCCFLDEFLMTMSTDGYICFWTIDWTNLKMEIIYKLKHNQSGINSFDIEQKEMSWLIATGGDDQSVYLSEIVIQGHSIRVLKTVSTKSVHTAQVTGVKLMPDGFLLTTGIDQTICKLSKENLRLIDKQETCVSDVKGFVILPNEKKMLIYGAGIELLTFF